MAWTCWQDIFTTSVDSLRRWMQIQKVTCLHCTGTTEHIWQLSLISCTQHECVPCVTGLRCSVNMYLTTHPSLCGVEKSQSCWEDFVNVPLWDMLGWRITVWERVISQIGSGKNVCPFFKLGSMHIHNGYFCTRPRLTYTHPSLGPKLAFKHSPSSQKATRPPETEFKKDTKTRQGSDKGLEGCLLQRLACNRCLPPSLKTTKPSTIRLSQDASL